MLLSNKLNLKGKCLKPLENALEETDLITSNFIENKIDANSAVEQNENSTKATNNKRPTHEAIAIKEEESDIEEPTRSESKPETEVAKMK